MSIETVETRPKVPKNSYSESMVVKIRWTALSELPVDLHEVYRILRFLAEKKQANVTDIVKNLHLGYATVKRYVEFLRERELVKVEQRGKEKILRITEKGYDVLVVMSRVYGILNLKVD